MDFGEFVKNYSAEIEAFFASVVALFKALKEKLFGGSDEEVQPE